MSSMCRMLELVVWHVAAPLPKIRGNGMISGQKRPSEQAWEQREGASGTGREILTEIPPLSARSLRSGEQGNWTGRDAKTPGGVGNEGGWGAAAPVLELSLQGACNGYSTTALSRSQVSSRRSRIHRGNRRTGGPAEHRSRLGNM
jgi:hypothetical protein